MAEVYQWLLANPEKANAVSAVASAGIALFALVTAIASIYFTYKGLAAQARHNAISVRPMPFAELSIQQQEIALNILNVGLGPLVIRSLKIIHQEKDFDDFVDILGESKPKGVSRLFGFSAKIRPISPSASSNILSLKFESVEIDCMRYFKECIDFLSKIEVIIEYSDFYNTKYEHYRKSFENVTKIVRTPQK